jgi:hypothetical protein
MAEAEKTLVETIKEGIDKFKENVTGTTKQAVKNYYKPTPKNWRIAGDTIQDIAVIAGALLALFASPPTWIPIAIIVTGRIGKIITNFATK